MNQFEITSIQRGCVYDGTGVRTTVFFRGCMFKCPWCCNPESLKNNPDRFIDDNKCLYKRNIHSLLCKDCVRLSGVGKIDNCPFGVSTPVSCRYTLNELLAFLIQDKSLYDESNGGITLSGGDPIIQIDDLYLLLKRLKEKKISCNIETTLFYQNSKKILDVIPLIDEWIIDLKFQKENYTDNYFQALVNNLALLRKNNCKIIFRYVYTANSDKQFILTKILEVNLKKIEIIKCHSLSLSKYKKLGLKIKDYTPDDYNYNNMCVTLEECGIKVRQLKA